MSRRRSFSPLALAVVFSVLGLMLAGCGESAKEQAMKVGAAGPAEQLRQRLHAQADR